jgi:hypothetical protein
VKNKASDKVTVHPRELVNSRSVIVKGSVRQVHFQAEEVILQSFTEAAVCHIAATFFDNFNWTVQLLLSSNTCGCNDVLRKDAGPSKGALISDASGKWGKTNLQIFKKRPMTLIQRHLPKICTSAPERHGAQLVVVVALL